MKLLITGGLGFIGSNFCRRIINAHPHWEVINVDKMGMGSNLDNLKDLAENSQYRFVKGDICYLEFMKKLVRHVDAVVNIAAESHVDRSIINPPSFIENNTIGTYALLEAYVKNPSIRMVHVSTDEVYGSAAEGSFTEKDALIPSNPYSASKAAADMFVLSYCKTFGLNASITRCTNNFGPSQMLEKLLPKTIIRALKNLPIPIYGSGRNIRDWLYVLDHCVAIETVLEKGLAGEVYNVSAGNEVTNIEIVKDVLKKLEKPESLITYVEDRPGNDTRYSLDSTKLRTSLGWAPKINFQQALELTSMVSQ
jgi:dTDP-glucose 4,6-dehydratase